MRRQLALCDYMVDQERALSRTGLLDSTVPLGVREYPMGKREAQELAAKTAAVGTEWEELFKRHEALTASDAEYQ